MHWSVCPCASKILIVIKYQGVSQSCFSMFWKITSKLCLGNWDENFSRKPIIVSGFIRGKLDEPLYCCSLNFFINSTLLLYQFVVLIIALLVETFAAELALIGLISGVYSDVSIQCRTPFERLTTELAFVGFLLSVNYLVPAQSAGLTKAFPAHVADEGSDAGVHRHVSGQVVVGIEHCCTPCTWTPSAWQWPTGHAPNAGHHYVGHALRCSQLVALQGTDIMGRLTNCQGLAEGKI